MTEHERFMVDDAGTLIDKKTAECYDYMEEIVDLLNSQEQRIRELENELKDYSDANAQLEQRIQEYKKINTKEQT